MTRIAAGSDHAGFTLKLQLIEVARTEGHEVTDLGTHGTASVDYPEFGAAVGRAVAAGEAEVGLCVCGTGIGISIAANKVPGIRAAVVHDVTSARLTRAHNDANVVCFGERLIGPEVAKEALLAFLATPWDGGRHAHRVAQLAELDRSLGAPST